MNLTLSIQFHKFIHTHSFNSFILFHFQNSKSTASDVSIISMPPPLPAAKPTKRMNESTLCNKPCAHTNHRLRLYSILRTDGWSISEGSLYEYAYVKQYIDLINE